MSRSPLYPVILAAACGVLIPLVGCGGGRAVVTDDPLSDMRDLRLAQSVRIKAVGRAWDAGQQGTIDKTTVREDLKTVAWSSNWDQPMRLAAIRALFTETDERGIQDNRSLIRLMLPREPDPDVVALLSQEAAKRGWADATPSLIRSLSRQWPGVPDTSRPEFRAITTLNPGKPVASIVAETFLNPSEEGGPFGMVPAERARADAWDLLARVDSDGSVRDSLIEGAVEGGQAGPINDMRASLKELRCLPLSGEELRWLASLHDFRDGTRRAWWDQTAAVIATLDPRLTGKLQLRHLEPIRWASEHRSVLLSTPREQLLSELRTRLDGRQTHRRRARDQPSGRPVPETLKDWETKLSWADLVTILVIDDAVHDRAVVSSLFAQADMDREDTTTEYGGLLRAEPAPASSGFGVVLYPPRPSARRGDRHFVASTDMIGQSDLALAHYHFHVQDLRNSEFAGPSADDLAYAGRQGRNCLVFTSVARRTMNIDYYQPDGIVIDLGDISAP